MPSIPRDIFCLISNNTLGNALETNAVITYLAADEMSIIGGAREKREGAGNVAGMVDIKEIWWRWQTQKRDIIN